MSCALFLLRTKTTRRDQLEFLGGQDGQEEGQEMKRAMGRARNGNSARLGAGRR
jgi:hypothetical protein